MFLWLVTLMTITIELGVFHVLVVGYIDDYYHLTVFFNCKNYYKDKGTANIDRPFFFRKL